MRYICALIQHRLPAICCALLCSGALGLTIGGAFTCQFLKINYDDPHSPWNYENLVSESNEKARSYSDTHEIGIFCTSAVNSSGDTIFMLAKGFEIVSLVIISILTIGACGLSTIIKPTAANWKALSVVAVVAAGAEIPVFLLYTSKSCQISEQECVAGKGFFMQLWSVILLMAVMVISQCFNYPEYHEVIDAWRAKVGRNPNFFTPEIEGYADESENDINLSREFLMNDSMREESPQQKHGLARVWESMKFLTDFESEKNAMKHAVLDDIDYDDNSFIDEEIGINESEKLDMPLHFLDTRSDSSLLMIRIGLDADDDRASMNSFELNLDEHSIDNHSIFDFPSEMNPTPTQSPCNSVMSSDCETTMSPAQFSPSSRAATGLTPEQNDSLQYPSQELLAVNTEIVQPPQKVDALSYPTQSLRGKYAALKDEEAEYRPEISPSKSFVKAVVGAIYSHERSRNDYVNLKESSDYQSARSMYSMEKDDNIFEKYNTKRFTDGQDKDEQFEYSENLNSNTGEIECLLPESVQKAIVAGTNAAEMSNNSQDEPEPVYYTSSDSETSSISASTYNTNEQLDMSHNDACSHKVSPVPVKTEEGRDMNNDDNCKRLVSKKRASRYTGRSKSLKSHRSVCSKVSFDTFTIDEETDLELEREEHSDDDFIEKGPEQVVVGLSPFLFTYDIISPLNNATSVKSSPSKLVTSNKSSFLDTISSLSIHEISDDEEDREATRAHSSRRLIKRRSHSVSSYRRSRVVHVVSPTRRKFSEEDGGQSSDDSSCLESISTNARRVRKKRIKRELKRSRSLPPKKLSDIIIRDASAYDSYGSDEASC